MWLNEPEIVLFCTLNSLFDDPLCAFIERSNDPFLEETEGSCLPGSEASGWDWIASDLISSSSKSLHLENLSSQIRNGEKPEFHLNFNKYCGLGLLPPDLDGNASKLMRRSDSSSSFENNDSYSLPSQFNCVSELQMLQNQAASQLQGSSFSSAIQMRELLSNGNLPNATTNVQPRGALPPTSPPSMEESNTKARRYTAEERKERIDRYRAKRTHRNFNKTIKYVCRKTLADNRPRIRGRFARQDMFEDIPTSSLLHHHDAEKRNFLPN
ncbi:two-component response regulator-like PRR1 [Andrographis paniculata]|uniref:two-component response regulator-like PRR1 n=1 Tax=Andrographis paniculata TaxID=175694 RepID=UPI0021E86ADA|nr:two-component response regulator-like PRR1 [Andrographis paniculata]